MEYSKTKIYNNDLQADLVIAELFHSAEILSITDEIYEKAKRRVRLGNPPGKNGSYGDAVNWEIILANSEILDDLHIVANDKDYFSMLNLEDINPFLKIEYNEHMIGEVTCYRSLTSFFKMRFPKLNLIVEQEKEDIILNLVNSSSFAMTRKELKRLRKYNSYSLQQIEDLLYACFNNSQINWILSDDDIKSQIIEIFENYRDKLSIEFRDEFLYNWHHHFPDDTLALKEDENLPF